MKPTDVTEFLRGREDLCERAGDAASDYAIISDEGMHEVYCLDKQIGAYETLDEAIRQLNINAGYAAIAAVLEDLEKAFLERGRGTAHKKNGIALGQVWRDCDPQMQGFDRRLKVVEIMPNGVRCEIIQHSNPKVVGKRVTIKPQRFRPTKTGYVLVDEAA